MEMSRFWRTIAHQAGTRFRADSSAASCHRRGSRGGKCGATGIEFRRAVHRDGFPGEIAVHAVAAPSAALAIADAT